MTQIPVAIVGAGPYGLSLAAHFNARGVDHRIFGRSMQFWSEVANAGGERYLKSFCFGTNISIPSSGYRFNDFNAARDLPTTEPCSIANFAAYGRWVQQENVPWLEQLDVVRITIVPGGFELCLSDGEKVKANRVIIATGLSFYASLPSVLKQLSPAFLSHTSTISNFAAFKGLSVVTVGAGQSALEAAALIHEAGATSQLLVRDDAIAWNTRIERSSNFWQRLRSPVSPLGTGPKAWLLAKFPGAMHRVPANTRRKFIESYLPPDGAWWLKNRVVDHVVLHTATEVIAARPIGGRVQLDVRDKTSGHEWKLVVDHVVAGTGYQIDVDHLGFLDPTIRTSLTREARAPRLNANFESSLTGLYFTGPSAVPSFGPLFRFVAGAEYTATVIAQHLGGKSS